MRHDTHSPLPGPRATRACWLSILCLSLAAALPAAAQDSEGLEIDVVAGGGVSLFQMAVPDAINLGGAADTIGIVEATTGTVVRTLKISGFFNLIEKAAFLADPTQEGMDPQYKSWFNIGTQGLVKAGYTVSGNRVTVDLRLYSIDSSKRVALPAPYDQPQSFPLEVAKIRHHTQGFVDEIIRFYTKEPGMFATRIVLTRRVGQAKELFMLSPDGLDEVQLTRAGATNVLPAYGGGRIYFTSFRDGGAHLFMLRGGSVTKFASYKGLNMGAALSPDGKVVAATLSKDGNPEIYLLNPDSGAVIKQLTTSWGIDASPAWSPDGRQIAFVSDRHGSPQIWLMNADGSGQRRLTFQGDYNQTPDWSPKGDRIAFTARDERATFDLFTVTVEDGSIQRLTQNQGNNEEPSFSPDGRYIAFTSTRSGSAGLYVMTSDGRMQTRVSRGKGEYATPSWGR